MKKSKADTAETRRRIVETAAKTFKSKGINATGVAEIMGAVGLTHGGFYRHFSSKEQLVAEASAVSMALMVDATRDAAAAGRSSLLKHMEEFLSVESRDNSLAGCPLVATGSELVRADAETRRVMTEGIEAMITVLAESSSMNDSLQRRDEALFTMASLIGALTLSRIVDDPLLSEQILCAGKRRLVDRDRSASPPESDVHVA